MPLLLQFISFLMERCSNFPVLQLKTGIILNEDEGIVASEGDGIESSLCFYDVLADHYVRMPENGKPILDLIVQLWSQSFVSHIFALLFHKWVRIQIIIY